MGELQETIVENRNKNKPKSEGETFENSKKTGCKEEAAAGVRAVFYMTNKKTLIGCISLPLEESLNSEEIVKNYQKQLSYIKSGKDSTLAHCGSIACFGNLCVDMQECIGFEVIFFQRDSAGIVTKPLSPAINCSSDLTVKSDALDMEENVSNAAAKEDKIKDTLPAESSKGSFVFIPEEKAGHTTERRKRRNEELHTKAYRLRALGIDGKDA